MHPILFDIRGFEVHTYGVMGALGFLFTAITALIRGHRMGIPNERMADLIFWSAVAGLIGARVVFVAQNPGAFEHWTGWMNFRTGGLVFYGAILFGIPVGSLLMWRFKMDFFATWDIFGAAFPVAHGIARLGCYAAGCCHGLPWAGPWAVTFTDPRSVAPLDVPLHPTQLYEAFALFAIGAAMQVLYVKKRWHGQVMLAYLVLYAIARAVVEELRGDASRGWFYPDLFGELLTYSQGISVILAVLAVVVFGVLARRAPSNLIRGPVAE